MRSYLADRVTQRAGEIETLGRWEECWYNRFPSIQGVAASLMSSGLDSPTRATLEELSRIGLVVDEMLREEEDCEGPPGEPGSLDVWFVLDVSDSMNQEFINSPGTTKIDAAKVAIIAALDHLASYANDSRAALLTYSGGTSPLGSPPTYATFLDYWTGPTTDFAFIADTLNFGVGAFGSTPTAHALHLVADEIEFEQGIDPSRKPVLILITDGVATISYGDTADPTRGYSFVDSDVQEVEVSNGVGGFYPIPTVRGDGQFYAALGLYAGEPLADVMEAAIDAMMILNLQIHGTAVDGGFFNAGIVEYVAFTGDGLFAAPENQTEFTDALTAALDDSAFP